MSSTNPRQARLEANIGALAIAQRTVAERLCGPVVDTHLNESQDGRVMLQHRSRSLPLALDETIRAELFEDLEEGVEVFLFGAGDPRVLEELLEAGYSVTLWDRDLALIRHCLLYTSPSPRDQRGSRMPSSA